MTDTKELDEVLHRAGLAKGFYRITAADKTTVNMLSNTDTYDETKQAILDYISKHYISKDKVLEAIGEDDPVDKQTMKGYKEVFGEDCKEYQEMAVYEQANAIRAYLRKELFL